MFSFTLKSNPPKCVQHLNVQIGWHDLDLLILDFSHNFTLCNVYWERRLYHPVNLLTSKMPVEYLLVWRDLTSFYVCCYIARLTGQNFTIRTTRKGEPTFLLQHFLLSLEALAVLALTIKDFWTNSSSSLLFPSESLSYAWYHPVQSYRCLWLLLL